MITFVSAHELAETCEKVHGVQRSRHLAQLRWLENLQRGVPSSSSAGGGIKRYMTPDAKPLAVKRRAWTTDAKQQEKRPFAGITKKHRIDNELHCQVCQLKRSSWHQSQPALIDVYGRAIRVPGLFCSKACYEHV